MSTSASAGPNHSIRFRDTESQMPDVSGGEEGSSPNHSIRFRDTERPWPSSVQALKRIAPTIRSALGILKVAPGDEAGLGRATGPNHSIRFRDTERGTGGRVGAPGLAPSP